MFVVPKSLQKFKFGPHLAYLEIEVENHLIGR